MRGNYLGALGNNVAAFATYQLLLLKGYGAVKVPVLRIRAD